MTRKLFRGSNCPTCLPPGPRPDSASGVWDQPLHLPEICGIDKARLSEISLSLRALLGQNMARIGLVSGNFS